MVFVFVEDGSIEVIGSITLAKAKYNAIDVESGVYMFYDNDGVYLRPVFDPPNTCVSLFGKRLLSKSGVYDLVRDPDSVEDSIELAIYEADEVVKNNRFNNKYAILDWVCKVKFK